MYRTDKISSIKGGKQASAVGKNTSRNSNNPFAQHIDSNMAASTHQSTNFSLQTLDQIKPNKTNKQIATGTQSFQSPKVIGIAQRNNNVISTNKAAQVGEVNNRPSLKKSPSAVINKYYKNFGQAQMGAQNSQQQSIKDSKNGLTITFQGIGKAQEIKRQRKDLTITFQKERSGDHTQESNSKPIPTDGIEEVQSQQKETPAVQNQAVVAALALASTTNTSNQITQANSLQASIIHQRTQSYNALPNQNTGNQQTTTTLFNNPSIIDNDHSKSSNKIAAMTCILKGFQHLNQSEFCMNMKKQVLDRKGSYSQFQKNLLFDFENQGSNNQMLFNLNENRNFMRQNQLDSDEENKEDEKEQDTHERVETAPHFYIPDGGQEELSIIDKNQYPQQESFFNCPEVSPVKTDKASFANRDETQSILDHLYPQALLRKNSCQTFKSSSSEQQSFVNQTAKGTGQQLLSRNNQTVGTIFTHAGSQMNPQTFTCSNSQFSNEGMSQQYDIKDFKEQYVKFGMWPEMNYFQQKNLKKKNKQLEFQNKMQKSQIDQLKRANLSLQQSLQTIQKHQFNKENINNPCLRSQTCFESKKQNNRYVPCQNCTGSNLLSQCNQNSQISGLTTQMNRPSSIVPTPVVSHHQRSRSQNDKDQFQSPRFQNTNGEIIQSINALTPTTVGQGQTMRNNSITLDEIKEALKLIALQNQQLNCDTNNRNGGNINKNGRYSHSYEVESQLRNQALSNHMLLQIQQQTNNAIYNIDISKIKRQL